MAKMKANGNNGSNAMILGDINTLPLALVAPLQQQQQQQAGGIDEFGGGVPYVAFSSGQMKPETVAKFSAALPPGQLFRDGLAFLGVGQNVYLLPEGATYMWLLDSWSCWAVTKSSKAGFEIRSSSKEKYTHDPKRDGADTKAPQVHGRALVLVAFKRNADWIVSCASLRTTPGRREGLVTLLKVREVAESPAWVSEHNELSAIPAQFAWLRAAMLVSFAPVSADGNTWTGFKGRVVPPPVDPTLWAAIKKALTEENTLSMLAEWLARERAEFESHAI